MKRIYLSLLLGMSAIGVHAQFTSTAVTSGTCNPATGNPTSDNVNTQATLNRIGHLESGTYGNINGQWSTIGIPNLSTIVPNSCNLYGFTTNWDTDRFFCGLKNESDNIKQAVIGWGDDDGTNPSLGLNRLIFAFYNTTLHDGDANGREVATMYPNGNMGIGASFQTSTPPARRLDVHDNTGPQLRLTYALGPGLPICTEFQTTSVGDLYIAPIGINAFPPLPIPRRVGIGISTPATTLHVAGDGIFRGTSRDFRLTNSSTAQSSSVLCVDQSGVGGHAGIQVKGDNSSSNYPTIGFTSYNDAGNVILGADIVAVPTRDVAGSETMDLTFLTKPLGLQVTERVRIVGRTGYTGFNVTNPTQRVDIDSTARLRKMPNNAANVLITGVQQSGVGDYVLNYLAYPNNTNQVLLGNGTWGTVPGIGAANNGLTSASGIVQLGQATCASTGTGQLIRDSYIPMNNFNLLFVDASTQTYNKNRIGIGTCTPVAKVEVVRSVIGSSIDFNPIGMKVTNLDGYQRLGYSMAVNGINSGLNRLNVGGQFESSNGNQNWAIRGIATTYVVANPNRNEGGHFEANDNRVNVGAYAEVGDVAVPAQVLENMGVVGIANYGNTLNYGVYGSTIQTSTGADYAGYFNGDLWYTGSLYAPSDENYKTNIQPISNMLGKLAQLDVKTYDFVDEKGISFPAVNQVGIMAQNLEKVFPTLVKKSYLTSPEAVNTPSLNKEIKAVNYVGLIPVLVGAVKELDAKIAVPSKEMETELADLKTKYNQLSDLLNEICSNGCDNLRVPTTGTAKSSSLLFQNIPNPFTKSTVINYSIAEGAEKAEMLLADLNGKPLQKIDLEITKHGTLSVPADNLSAGIITYSLIVDGRLIDTKKMMLTGN